MSTHQIYFHLAWTTRDRAPMIDAATRTFLELVQFSKGGSSYAASRLPGNILGLRWAKEYSVTTVGPKQLAAVRRRDLHSWI
jgi:hypothetical protein